MSDPSIANDHGISLVRRVFYVLLRTTEEVKAPHHTLFREAGLSGPSFNVLRLLIEAETGSLNAGAAGLPVETIAKQMIQQDPDVSRLTRRLEEKGLLSKFRDPDDRRVHRVVLTSKGRELVSDLMARSHRLLDAQFGGLAESDCAQLLETLDQIRAGQTKRMQVEIHPRHGNTPSDSAL